MRPVITLLLILTGLRLVFAIFDNAERACGLRP